MEETQRKSMKWVASVLLFAMTAFIVSSCKDSETFSSENAQTSNNESTQEATTDEVDDMAVSALNSGDNAGGRVQTTDDRLACATVEVVFDNPDTKVSGTATINFGTSGCTDSRGNVRKGTIVIAWTGGRWFLEGASHTITLTNYSINGVSITGTRTITCTSSTATASGFTITWNVAASHNLTWPDNTTASREVNKTKVWAHTLTEDTFTISNGPGGAVAAAGTNRHGKVYTMTITTPIVYLRTCAMSNKVFLPVSGVKVVTADQRVLTIDFGNGTCDNTFTVTVNGISRTLTAKNDSSGD